MQKNKIQKTNLQIVSIKRCENLFKTIQKHIYNFLLTKYGLCIIVTSIIFIILSILKFSDTILEYHMERVKYFNRINEIDETSVDYLARHEQYDVVYTWVNGSDDVHKKELKNLKQTLNSRNSNATTTLAQKQYEVIELQDFIDFEKQSQAQQNETVFDKWNKKFPCYYKLCIQSNNLLIIKPKLNFNLLNDIKNKKFSKYNFNLINFNKKNLTLIELSSFDVGVNLKFFKKISAYLAKQIGLYRIYFGYYTIDDCNKALHCIDNIETGFGGSHGNAHRFILKYYNGRKDDRITASLKSILSKQKVDVKQPQVFELPSYLNDINLDFKLEYKYKMPSVQQETQFEKDSSTGNTKKKNPNVVSTITNENENTLCFIKVKDEYDSAENLTQYVSFMNEQNDNVTLEVHKANIVWDLGDPFDEDLNDNRFYDNDELKYSLRSLELNAPWVRNIYLVTNGQVPNWLNMSNPRIKHIKHEDIFVNKSHLPTFSSSAIETHIHRITGLSKHFIYFNDDILLGKPIWPDDFYTQSKGYRIYLAWSLPGCNPSCPNTWINDGYCDKACNTSECEFDGGDCTAKNLTTGYLSQLRMSASKDNLYCSAGCSALWLSDRYCDNACNVAACAFDMGDCGVARFNQLYQIRLFDRNELNGNKINVNYTIPKNLTSFYVNFTYNAEQNVEYRIENASYKSSNLIRSISITNKFHILTILLLPENVNETNSNIEVYFMLCLNGTAVRRVEFYLNINLSGNPVFDTTTPIPQAIVTQAAVSYTFANLTNLQPKNIQHIDITVLDVNLTDFKILNKILDDYRQYLNWSLTHGYLTDDGLNYKLKYLKKKINQVLSDKQENIDLDALFELDDILLSKYDLEVFLKEYEKDNPNDVSFKKRRLLDTYANSLRHVNKLFNHLYGFMPRRVPAHMPHFIDRDVMFELQEKFKEEFDRTSSNQIRSNTDMQYAFTYYYYLQSELVGFNMTKIFREYDRDHNLELDENELFLLGLKANTNFKFKNCSNINENRVDLEEFLSCAELSEVLRDNLWSSEKAKKYKYELTNDDDVAFQMVGGSNMDPLKFDLKLNDLLKNLRKFICLNDNIDHKQVQDADKYRSLLKRFYTILYPLKSQFEQVEETLVSVDYSNQDDYVEKDDTLDESYFISKLILFLIIFLFLYIIVYYRFYINIKDYFFYMLSLRHALNRKDLKRARRKRRSIIRRLTMRKRGGHNSSSSDSEDILNLNDASSGSGSASKNKTRKSPTILL